MHFSLHRLSEVNTAINPMYEIAFLFKYTILTSLLGITATIYPIIISPMIDPEYYSELAITSSILKG